MVTLVAVILTLGRIRLLWERIYLFLLQKH